MKINQLGTLAIVSVVFSITAACSGSPTKPTAIDLPLGDGARVTPVTVSNVKSIGTADQICTGGMQTFDESDQTGDVPNADIPAVNCDSSTTVDQPQDEPATSDVPSADSLRARRLHR